MKIFIIIAFIAIVAMAVFFLRMAWKNYKEEGIVLSRYWLYTLPTTVTQPFCYAIFLIFMAFMVLSANL